MTREEAEILLKKYSLGECSDAESVLVERWLFKLSESGPILSETEKDEMRKEVWNNLPKDSKPAKRVKLPIWLSTAAALILSLALGYLTYRHFIIGNKMEKLVAVYEGITPGSNKAVLTLANGQKINLSDAENGTLAKQANVSITKTADGQVTYTSTNNSTSTHLQYNTIETPNGGQYQLRLPDGTKVWLNAGSTLKYPVAFAKNERRVNLNGEAYFEVAKMLYTGRADGGKAMDKSAPFIVSTAVQTVKVLGTHFNINAYVNEPQTTTTLEEGSVMVSNNKTHASSLLKPGQQSQADDKQILVREANVETALSWKNGLIKFTDADIKSMLRMVSRWYDIDVAYEGKIPDRQFNGGFFRNAKIEVLLNILKKNNINFEVTKSPTGRAKLTIKP